MSVGADTGAQVPEHAPFAINRDVAFLYDGFDRGVLLVQRCDRCAVLRHPPSPFCPECHCGEWTTIEASGRGRLHSYTVHHHPPIPPWPTPHAVALVDMEEGFRFVAAVTGVEPGSLRIGQPMVVRYMAVSGGRSLPTFERKTNL